MTAIFSDPEFSPLALNKGVLEGVEEEGKRETGGGKNLLCPILLMPVKERKRHDKIDISGSKGAIGNVVSFQFLGDSAIWRYGLERWRDR